MKFPIILIPKAGTTTSATSLENTFASVSLNSENFPKEYPIKTRAKRGRVEKNRFETQLPFLINDYEIIIVDDCSTDGTREILKKIKDEKLIFFLMKKM